MSKAKWNEQFIVDAYRLAKSGMTESKMAKIFGCSDVSFAKWKQEHPGFAYALQQARSELSARDGRTFADYVLGTLPEELQDAWKEIMKLDDAKSGPQRVSALIDGFGKEARQQLWLYAMVHTNFSVSQSCRMLGIPRHLVELWKTDPEFALMVDHLVQYKKDFFEQALADLVASGNTLATIFANKTLNKDRGYGSSVDVNVNGKVQHNHAHVVVSLEQLNLPLEIRLQILEHYRKMKESQALPDGSQQRALSLSEPTIVDESAAVPVAQAEDDDWTQD
jgi:hypothetical protein